MYIESHESLDGCYVSGAHFARSRFGFELCVLDGRVATKVQRYEIVNVCGRIMAQMPEWREAIRNRNFESVPRLAIAPAAAGKELDMTESDWGNSLKFYADGLKAYSEGRLDSAIRSFHFAMIEAPDEPTYRYWRALAELSAGRREDSYKHLLAVWRRAHVTAREELVITRSFHRVQGPIREQFADMELRIRSHASHSAFENQIGFASMSLRPERRYVLLTQAEHCTCGSREAACRCRGKTAGQGAR